MPNTLTVRHKLAGEYLGRGKGYFYISYIPLYFPYPLPSYILYTIRYILASKDQSSTRFWAQGPGGFSVSAVSPWNMFELCT